ncbi:MAG TPA: 2-dehydropantoate 2-reductase [Casimicrobiaceae bacterium]|nr:2-dehydropantoate 2-reductase [Casimicrobiaceae bacterium]
MRIAVIGAGGVGGYFGAKFARAGHDVAFVARGEHLDAMRERGLRIESALGDIVLPKVVATDDPLKLGAVDIVMLCVKLWDVERAASQVAPLVERGGVVIPFQNGIDSPDILQRTLGESHVLGGVAYIAAAIRAPGIVAQTGSMAKLRVGAFDDRLAERARAFVAACTTADIDAEVATDIRRAIWEKFAFLTALSGMTALSRQPVGIVRGDPDLRAAFEAALKETISVANARSVALGDDFVERQMRALDGLPAEMRSSMQNDLLAGRRLEAPWLCGRVAQLAAENAISAPVNATVYAGLKPFLHGEQR